MVTIYVLRTAMWHCVRKVNGKVVPVHGVKAYEGVEVYFHSF